MTRFLFSSLAAVTAALAAPAIAASPVTLEGEVQLETTLVEDGGARTVLTEPKVVVPGNRLLFTTRYRNEGAVPIQNFVITNPIPAAVSLADGTAEALEVSVDEAKTWGRLASLKVAAGEGTFRPAAAGDVTHVRWLVPTIAAGAGGVVQYHAIVR